MRNLIFYFGGLPRSEWDELYSFLRSASPTSLHGSEAENGEQPIMTGCFGGLSLRSDDFRTDLLRQYDAELSSYPPNEIIRGYCQGQSQR